MESSSGKKFLTLKTFDKEEFVVEESVAVISQTIKTMVEQNCDVTIIPIANVDAKTMARVIEYCKMHVEQTDAKILEEFDKQFVNVDTETLYYLLMAANYLEIPGLLDRLVKQTADTIRGKTPEQIRRTFNIQNDFTPEEQEEIRRENTWASEFSQ